MPDLKKVVARFAAPVPVGHRVEVVWYQKVTNGWNGSFIKAHPYLPQIKDLETGIEYLNSELVANEGSWAVSKPRPVSDEVPASFEVHRALIGKVRRCRLITIGVQKVGIQTHLDIEPETEQTPYR